MSPKIVQVFISTVFLLTACVPEAPTIPVSNPTLAQTAMPSLAPSETPGEPHRELTSTPKPPTPLSTIPTFTPTFDVSTIAKVTRAAKADCPKENPAAIAAFATPDAAGFYELHRSAEVLDYLNSGGQWNSEWGQRTDLTGDSLNEIVFNDFAYYVFGCKDGRYENLLQFAGDSGAHLESTPDLNKNGIPELILFNIVHYGYIDVSIFEWDGHQFRSLINLGGETPEYPPIDWVSFNYGNYKLKDTNGDGLKEIIVVYDVHEQSKATIGGYEIAVQLPIRDQTIVLSWNGQNFVNIKQGNNQPPQYRFQAVQDGDEQVRYGNYTAALSLYKAAIFDDRLDWWSAERRGYEVTQLSQYELTPTIFPTAVPDLTEYPKLAAYAYYRIVLLHVAQGYESDAETVYQTVERKFSNDPYGRPYYEMATEFWKTYHSTRNMYDGCAAAIQYAAEHPAILVPLGSDYHGGYSHSYVPEDVCPFR